MNDSDDRRERILNNLSISALILNTRWKITYANAAAAKMFKYPIEEIVGRPLLEFIDDRGKPPSIKKTWTRGGTEKRFIRKDGTKMWGLLSIHPLDQKRSVKIATIVDLTERKKVENAFIRSEHRYRSLFTFMKNGYSYNRILCNRSGMPVDYIILEANAAFRNMLGLKGIRLLGRRASEILPMCKEPYDWVGTFGKVAAGGGSLSFEEKIEAVGCWFSVSVYCPEKSYFVAIYEDVTERKKLEELLVASESFASIGRTAAMVGHDLRNPLQGIIGYVGLAQTSLDEMKCHSTDKKEIQDSLHAIEDQIHYMDKIVSDLQDYARPLKPDLRGTDFQALLSETLSSLNVPRDVSVIIRFQKEFPEVVVDKLIMKRVLMNLLSNAIQAMPEGGKLTVDSSYTHGSVTISIKDTGIGIPEKNKPKIFTPLFSTKPRGQGFGLAVSKRLVEAHKGTITFKSKEGKGSEFIVSLPRLAPAP